MTAAPRLIPLAALLLAGCNLAPSYSRPQPPIPATLPLAAGGGEEAGSIAGIGWRDFFTDSKLRDVIALALANNRDLRIALANVEQARAQYRIRRADLFPALSASGGLVYQRQPSVAGASTTGREISERYTAGVGLSAFEIDLFGRTRNLSKAALETYLATEEARKTVRISLIAEVATAYLALAADREHLRIARETLAAQEAMLDLTQARQRVGVASGLDTRQARTSYEQARADIAAFTTAVDQDRNALDLLVGATVADTWLPDGIAPVTQTALPVGVSSTVLLGRPDVQAAEHLLIAQNANIGAARAAFFPNISLTAALGTVSAGLSGLFGAGTGTWSVAPSIVQPIFDGGANRAGLRSAEAARDAALAGYEKAIQTAFREVADALARHATIGEQVAAQRALERAAAESLRIAEGRYRLGTDSYLATLTAQQTLYAARQNRAAIELTAGANMVELYRAFGGGLR
ncbi:MAG TPA: efflux transporter outer membrane subunit [Sphingomonadaceae bacterium]|nr:efflux transporter outer membrane subunit [Sphingomonadaceae bacterium]